MSQTRSSVRHGLQRVRVERTVGQRRDGGTQRDLRVTSEYHVDTLQQHAVASCRSMTAMAHDTAPGAPAAPAPARLGAGLVLAVVSAVSFGLSGALARGLLDIGWTPGSVTLVRVALGALVLVPAGVVALRGRWALLRRHARLVVLYGTLAVAGAQFCYFAAIEHMQVGPAILIEYTAPAAVVVWLWLRHGQRPGRLTLVGAVLRGGPRPRARRRVGCRAVPGGRALGARRDGGLRRALRHLRGRRRRSAAPHPGRRGLLVGTGVLGALAVVGVLPLAASTAPPSYAGHDAWTGGVPSWRWGW